MRIVLFIVPWLFLTPANANVFQSQDAQGIDALKKRILSAESDNLAVQQSMNNQHAFEFSSCLGEINQQIDSFYYIL